MATRKNTGDLWQEIKLIRLVKWNTPFKKVDQSSNAYKKFMENITYKPQPRVFVVKHKCQQFRSKDFISNC